MTTRPVPSAKAEEVKTLSRVDPELVAELKRFFLRPSYRPGKHDLSEVMFSEGQQSVIQYLENRSKK